MPLLVTVDELKQRLTALVSEHEDSAVVFDADGTLWSHDVGCMVFDAAVEQGIFRDEALPALREEAQRQSLQITAETANDAARALQTAWYSQRYGEREAAEMQVWAYVGFSESEFRRLVRDALERGRHTDTLHDDVLELAEWVKSRGARACVVSASPLWVVQEATRDLGFLPDDIAAGVPNTTTGANEPTIAPGLKEPLPYGPDKVVAGKALLRGARWLAALGDSHFDLHMMREAEVGVGIGDKASMLEGLADIAHAVRLEFSKD